MKIYSTILLTLFIPKLMHAQPNQIAGAYYLQGVMETASGFNLHSDSTFDFFFSYGALDRYGSGKWTVSGDKVIFNSKPKPGDDFRLIESGNDNNDFITINFPAIDPQYGTYFHCLIKTGGKNQMIDGDSHGRIIIHDKTVDSIQLVFEFCPEKISTFPIDARQHNVYSFQPEQWLTEYFFKDFALTIKADHLEGRHPLLTKDNCVFIKD